MISTIVDLLRQLVKYLAVRETNYVLRTLQTLYEDESKIAHRIITAEGSVDFNPDSSYVLRLHARLKQTRRLIGVLESQAFPSEEGDES